MDETYDVVVIGGGAAGLSGAVALGRARRSVLVVDGGEPRNAPAGHVHNFLTRDGSSPADLLAAGRAEVLRYGGEVAAGEVVSAEPLDGDGFAIGLADGRSVRARRLLVATGLVDELPDVPGLAQRWGRDVLHCPYCHGWEVRDLAIGVLGGGPVALHQVQLFRGLSADVTLFTHTGAAPTLEEYERLDALGVTVVAGEVAGLEVADARLTGVRLASGEVVARQALVVAPRFAARVGALASLGLVAVPQRMGDHVVGTVLEADPTGATAVPGVWAAGNVTDGRAQVVTSAAAGLLAGAAINADLVEEEARRAVADRRAGQGHGHGHGYGGGAGFGHAFYEELYRSRPALWSGRPNPQLVTDTADLPAGAALDVGSGEGADALWLAERGWRVTAVDFSATALQRAAEHADRVGLGDRIDWTEADITEWAPPVDRFDLVSAQFMQLPAEQRDPLFARLAAAVAPGGTLLVVGHHPDGMPSSDARPTDVLFTAEEVAKALDPAVWDLVAVERRTREQGSPDSRVVTVHDAVLVARRRP